MNKTTALIAALTIASSSCSLLLMETLPPGGHDGAGEPRCTASKGWPVVDALSAVIDLGVVALAAGEPDSGAVIAVFGLDAVVSLVSAVWGFSSANECIAARRAMDEGGVDPVVDQGWGEPEPTPPVDAEPTPAFYCTRAPDGETGTCVRSIEACENAQDARLREGNDAMPCEGARAAVCFTGPDGERCFPTVGMCRTEWALVDGVATDCEDAR